MEPKARIVQPFGLALGVCVVTWASVWTEVGRDIPVKWVSLPTLR